MRHSVNLQSKLELYFHVTKPQLLVLLTVLFSEYTKILWRGKQTLKDLRSGSVEMLYDRKAEGTGCWNAAEQLVSEVAVGWVVLQFSQHRPGMRLYGSKQRPVLTSELCCWERPDSSSDTRPPEQPEATVLVLMWLTAGGSKFELTEVGASQWNWAQGPASVLYTKCCSSGPWVQRWWLTAMLLTSAFAQMGLGRSGCVLWSSVQLLRRSNAAHCLAWGLSATWCWRFILGTSDLHRHCGWGWHQMTCPG